MIAGRPVLAPHPLSLLPLSRPPTTKAAMCTGLLLLLLTSLLPTTTTICRVSEVRVIGMFLFIYLIHYIIMDYYKSAIKVLIILLENHNADREVLIKDNKNNDLLRNSVNALTAKVFESRRIIKLLKKI